MHLKIRQLAGGIVLALFAAANAVAQIGDEIPHPSYYLAKDAFYAGDYRNAERSLRREHGVRAGQSSWIDSICYHAMLGEVLYQEGRNAEALSEFDQACQTFLATPNWLLQVKFQSSVGGLRPDANRGRRMPPWGKSSRTFVIAQFGNSEQVAVGDLNAQQAYQTGGVVRAPMYWRVNVAEIMRATALAMRRRNELLGPLAPQDSISKQLSTTLARGNLAPANHWSNAWIDLLRGLAEEGMEKFDEADMLFGRSLVIEGQYDHPLTCVALLGQGRIAMRRGDSQKAAQMLAEAGFSSFYFDDWDALTQSTLDGWINHMVSGAAGIYPPLDAIATWTQANRLQHVSTNARLAQAESLLWLGQGQAGVALVEDANRRIGEMRNGLPGIHAQYLQAAVLLLQNKMDQGADMLTRAMGAQAGVSLRNFQIGRTSQMYDSSAISARLAVDFYKALLADPTPADWGRDPLDAMAVMATGQDGAFDRWFVAALERKDAGLALEIAERAKRREYLSNQPFGGRLLALRAILETPPNELSQEALLQRQRILGGFADYQTLVDAGQKIREQLLASPIVATTQADTKSLGALYDAWQRNAVERQRMLTQIAVRHMPSAFEFPPLRTTAELQQSLGAGEVLVEFHTAAGNMYGFFVTNTEVRMWQLPDARKLRAGLANLLKAIGNYGTNRQLGIADLKADAWRESTKEAYATLFGETKLDLAQTKGLVVVPDDLLWYLPFEVLLPPNGKGDKVLADLFPVRYGPTGALAVARQEPLRRNQHTGIVANDLKLGGDESDREALVKELETSFTGPIVFSESLPEPANVMSPLLDMLVVFDDIASTGSIGESPSLLPRPRGANKEMLNSWITLPVGGPERIVLTGVATEAEQGLKPPKRSSSRGNVRQGGTPGSEIFESLCNLMSGGARSILMTRWRTNGRTNYDLVREFAKELPNIPAADAWQRACLLARESTLDMPHEPRIKKSDETGELPTADHPFFWAGYILVDTGPRPEMALAKPADAAKKDATGKDVAGKDAAKKDAGAKDAAGKDAAKSDSAMKDGAQLAAPGDGKIPAGEKPANGGEKPAGDSLKEGVGGPMPVPPVNCDAPPAGK